MSGFSAQWLNLREAADHRSRCDFSAALNAAAKRSWHIVDLGCGAGSNLRYLRPRLPAPGNAPSQVWTCIDNDEALLQLLTGESVATLAADLSNGIAATLATTNLNSATDGDCARLVTASALLDLVSADWIDELVAACRTHAATAWFALSYDGRIELTPTLAHDSELCQLINTHQRSDKGFGPALGPQAHAYTCDALSAAGFDVIEATSDWLLDASEDALIEQLLDGWLEAAREVAGDGTVLQRWETTRRAELAAGRLAVRVGHRDLLAVPPRIDA